MNGKNLIDQFAENPSEGNIKELIRWADSNNPSNNEIAYLACKLAASGSCLERNDSKADIPSTGGPSSLSTIVCPLILTQFSFSVPKLGIPGRPAGGIDVLAQIPGYRFAFKKNEIEYLLSKSNYVHFLADENFAPLDKLLFDYRKSLRKIDVPPLVIASLLSKKLACGLNTTGLDIRVSSFGNFGRTYNEAELNALRFVDVGKVIGIKALCFLTSTEYALQPYIGRGESLIAMHKIINRQLDDERQLSAHFSNCLLMSQSLSSKVTAFDFNKFSESFALNLELQGTSLKAFNAKVDQLSTQTRTEVLALEDGFFHYDLSGLRDLITFYQSKFTTDNQFSDPCGLHLLKEIGEHVCAGESLAEVRFDPSILTEVELRNNFSKVLYTKLVPNIERNFKIIGHAE